MRKFTSGLWRVLTFPFVLLFKIIAFPFRVIVRFNRFLNTEPEERPLSEVFTDLVTNEKVRAMMWDQIEALRAHLLRAVLGLAVAVGISSIFTRKLSVILAAPLQNTTPLGAIEITESVGVFMRIALISGITLAVPYIALEMWLFAAPGLKPRERKIGLMGIPLAAILFASGVMFTYFILPAAINAMEAFNRYMEFTTNWRPNSYYNFVTGLMFWIGLSFEFPLVIYVLTAMGFIKPGSLLQQWRLAMVIIAIAAAAITPTIDPVNMALVMGPMILLYFVSIGLSFLAYAGRRKAAQDALPVSRSGNNPPHF